MSRDTLRLLLIGSTVVAALGSVWFGVPRLRGWLTPDLGRVWLVAAALGDELASGGPHEVLAGSPVTLFAVVESDGDESRFFGRLERARLGDGRIVEVEPWSTWWYPLDFLWFKVEPLYPFDNENQLPEFSPRDIRYQETLMLAWGIQPRAAPDVQPSGDAFPKLEVGTMRFKVRAVVRDSRDRILDEVASPGADAVHAEEPEAQPLRLSVRASDSPLGTLQAWAGLPYVPILQPLSFGRHPAARFLGGTILDFWIANLRRRGAELPFFDSAELPRRGDTVVDEMYLADDGVYYWSRDPLRPITWETVQVGDLLAIEDHIGVLYQDRGPGGAGDGILNRWDRLLGGYFEPLRDIPLGEAFIEGASVYRLATPGDDGP